MATAAPWLSATVEGAPLSPSLALHSAVAPLVQTVQYRRGYRGYGGAGIGLGITGTILGGAIIASQPYGYGPGYAYGPDYYPGYVAVSPDDGRGEVAYCLQRYGSYDPRSGTLSWLRRPATSLPVVDYIPIEIRHGAAASEPFYDRHP